MKVCRKDNGRSERELLRPLIEQEALAWAVAECSPQEIDDINILQASILAMHRAVDQLRIRPELLLIDGNRFKPYPFIPHLCVIKGDSKFSSIAAASVLAKTYRDEFMEKLSLEFPDYLWQQNAGYPTKAHRKAIETIGPSIWHRKSFKLLKQMKNEE